MRTRHYLVTGLNADNAIVQIHIEVDPENQRFNGPLRCCVSASSTNFLREYLADFSITRVSSIKPIQGSIAKK